MGHIDHILTFEAIDDHGLDLDAQLGVIGPDNQLIGVGHQK
jgi:hypothetical protein